jgi:hypothetical protein
MESGLVILVLTLLIDSDWLFEMTLAIEEEYFRLFCGITVGLCLPEHEGLTGR